MVTVVNLRQSAFTVYIGRPGHGRPGPFGNPFIVGIHGVRGECIELFRSWIGGQLVENVNFGIGPGPHGSWPDEVSKDPSGSAFRERIRTIPSDAVLGCFCKPASCHGDAIAAFINSHSD